MSRLARARRRFRARRLQQRLARTGPPGTFVPHRLAAAADAGAPALAPLFAAAGPAFLEGLALIEAHGDDLARFGGPAPAPRFEQDWFPGLDAAALYALVRRHRPRQVVEIGSGHSTRIAARAIADGGLDTRFVAIDPAPRAAIARLPITWRREAVQTADPLLAAGLGANDVLFVDSSHVLVAGSDVAVLAGDWLPRLRPGALLHVHDVFLPDAYPRGWHWRGYNEQAVVAALLTGGFELVFASHWVRTRMPERLGPVARALPLPPHARESSLWLRRC